MFAGGLLVSSFLNLSVIQLFIFTPMFITSLIMLATGRKSPLGTNYLYLSFHFLVLTLIPILNYGVVSLFYGLEGVLGMRVYDYALAFEVVSYIVDIVYIMNLYMGCEIKK